jgi:hypothetical protein
MGEKRGYERLKPNEIARSFPESAETLVHAEPHKNAHRVVLFFFGGD